MGCRPMLETEEKAAAGSSAGGRPFACRSPGKASTTGAGSVDGVPSPLFVAVFAATRLGAFVPVSAMPREAPTVPYVARGGNLLQNLTRRKRGSGNWPARINQAPEPRVE